LEDIDFSLSLVIPENREHDVVVRVAEPQAMLW